MPVLGLVGARPPTSTTLVAAADDVGFPLFVKAVAGGGGRGMRRVERAGAAARVAVDAAMREARVRVRRRRRCSSSRRWSTRATSRCRSSPTPTGNVVHLYERDCSMQRRHQKVDRDRARRRTWTRELRDRICADAVAFARAHRLRQRGHGRVPARRARQPRLHRDEPAHPGRAHRHRAGHRPRPRDRPAAHRRGHDAARAGPAAGADPLSRRRAAVPGHHRGPGQRLPPRHRRDQRLPLAGRPRRAARRRHDPRRRRGQRALRLDAGQAHLQRPQLRERRPPGPPGRRRVPHPRASRRTCRSWPRCSTTPTSAPAGSPRASSTSARSLLRRPPARPTAAPGSSPTSPRPR